MGALDFHLEFQTEFEHYGDELITEADRRLRALAEGHSDMIGASVAMEELTGGETPHVYQARVIAYIRPNNVVAVEKRDAPETALKGALSAVERQVHELREKLRQS
jgi:hypothetical protein